MTNPIWQKNKSSSTIDDQIQAFLAGRDIELDNALLPYDIQATTAHVRGLNRINLLTNEECQTLCAGLADLATEFENDTFTLDSRFEDGHSAIEWYLTEKLGDVGKKVHLGRSRNDQILVATRLYLRSELDAITDSTHTLAAACLKLATAQQNTPMPGYTHLQRAVPSTVGLWFAAFAEAFIDDCQLLQLTKDWLNTSPLGTAAGYGVNVQLDRAGVADELNFDRLQINPMYAQNSRGKFEFQALTTLWQVLQDIRRLAWDLSLYTTAEFNFISLPDALTTGSSIMPNKRNPDLVELIRGMVAIIAGAMTELQQIISLPSGYQRDLQLTKEPMLRALTAARQTIEVTVELVASIQVNAPQMKAAIDGDMYATDRAVELACEGLAFRDAYRQTADEMKSLAQNRTPEQSTQARTSPGACADLLLNALQTRLTELQLSDS